MGIMSSASWSGVLVSCESLGAPPGERRGDRLAMGRHVDPEGPGELRVIDNPGLLALVLLLPDGSEHRAEQGGNRQDRRWQHAQLQWLTGSLEDEPHELARRQR